MTDQHESKSEHKKKKEKKNKVSDLKPKKRQDTDSTLHRSEEKKRKKEKKSKKDKSKRDHDKERKRKKEKKDDTTKKRKRQHDEVVDDNNDTTNSKTKKQKIAAKESNTSDRAVLKTTAPESIKRKHTTDKKPVILSTKPVHSQKLPPIRTYDSDSSSSSDEEVVPKPKEKNKVTSHVPVDHRSDSDSSSSNDQEKTSTAQTASKKTSGRGSSNSDKENSVLQIHRLKPFLHRQYTDEMNAKKRYKNRLVDLGLKVNPDFFISDSESDTDSDASYNGEPELEWHKKVENHTKIRKKMQERGWTIQTGPWNQNELLRLEKRIKKLARRENMSLETFRETILAEKPGKHIEFWWKVAKVFPDRALYPIIRHAMKAYSHSNYLGRWSEEEDQQLLNLVELHGSNFKEIAKHIDRHPAACEARHRVLKRKTSKVGKRWTKEEVDKLIATVEEYQAQHGPDISYDYVSIKGFDSERSSMQCRRKWEAIATVYKKDSTFGKSKQKVDLKTQLQLLERIQKGGWENECEIRFSKLQDDEFYLPGSKCRSQYYMLRNTVPSFEKMKLKDVLSYLIERRRKMLESLEE
ncbi:RNA polymerase I enhancer binding protein [Apophysomyces ossiformis]|uniref:RNA polymerase I enhancer binding protein n=1 Tax=Apophysomyces ossiformis TaxID=679940 RepID=A0A8H7EUI8_9FUNG|nr:RNA polymerase I enhancer binding protein [Apophysomyces ossiformis]